MNIPKFKSFDDLLHTTYKTIMHDGSLITGKRGAIKEIQNYSATLSNPRCRTSTSLDRRLVRSKFAEFIWYLSGSADKDLVSDYIKAYNKEESKNNKILGAYGPKMFGTTGGSLSQFERIVKQILTRKSTKQAYISISEPSDYRVRTEKHSSPPCTIGLHFLVRNNKLDLTTYMRSNDAYLGLPHDLFCFTMLQELIANKISTELGSYTHVCTSLHVYDNNFESVNDYLKEGLFEPIEMPVMKVSDMDTLQTVITAYFGSDLNVPIEELDDYWHDFSLFSNNFREIDVQDWLNKFRTHEIKELANCSITD